MITCLKNTLLQVTEGDDGGPADPGPSQSGPKGNTGTQRGRAGSDEVEGAPQLAPRAQEEQGGANRGAGGNAGGAGGGGGGGAGGGGRKNGEPDLEEKFGRFEIKPPTRTGVGVGPNMNLTAGSEQGDETVSMVSDTWYGFVLCVTGSLPSSIFPKSIASIFSRVFLRKRIY